MAVVAVACSPEEPTTPNDNNGGTEQEGSAPVLTITSAKSFISIAEGEEYTVTYAIENPVEGAEVVANIEDAWISLKEGVTEENTLIFVIAENTSEAQRQATVTLTYGSATADVRITQVGAVIVNNEPISTLTNDVEMVLNEDNSYVYADCFGDDYGTGIYMWQIYFMDVVARQMIWLEILCDSQAGAATEELVIPTGKYVGSDDKWSIGTMMIGQVTEDFDGLYNAGSWYTQVATDSQNEALAPIAGGVFNIEALDNDKYAVTYNVKDDRGNTITGTYEGRIAIEDFRTE